MEAREDLAQEIDNEHEREVLELAMRKVRLQIDAVKWAVFEDLAIHGKSGEAVAARTRRP